MNTKQLETVLSSPDSHGNLIVAIPKNCSVDDAITLANSISVRSLVESTLLPQYVSMADYSVLFAKKEKFCLPEYKKNFLEKCNTLGKQITITVL